MEKENRLENIKFIYDLNDYDYLSMLELWNREMGEIYPINRESFEYNVTKYKAGKYFGVKAIDEDKIVGFIILKTFDDPYLSSLNDSLFISLLYVSKKYRRRGIGSFLVDYALKIYKEDDRFNSLWLGKEIHNFVPGIPCEFDNVSDVFFERRGFTSVRYTHDLINRKLETYEIRNKEVKYEIIDKTRKDELISFIERNGWKRWAYEVREEFENDEDNKCYLVGLIDNKIVSFSKVNDLNNGRNSYNMMWKDRFNNLGGIGPLGVDKEYRGKKIGGDIIKEAVNTLIRRGVSEIMIDWTGLMELYSKYGFEVWKMYKYTYIKKEIN